MTLITDISLYYTLDGIEYCMCCDTELPDYIYQPGIEIPNTDDCSHCFDTHETDCLIYSDIRN